MAIKNAYAYFGMQCPFTYRDFYDSGFMNGFGGGIAQMFRYSFFKNKGLTVNVSGTNQTSVAFVLISHGVTGYGL